MARQRVAEARATHHLLAELLIEIRSLRAELRGLAQPIQPPGDGLAVFLAAWARLHGDRPFTATQALRMAAEASARGSELRNALELAVDLDADSPNRSLGRRLAKAAAGACTGGYAVELLPAPRRGALRFRVVRANTTGRFSGFETRETPCVHDPFNLRGPR